MIELGLVLSLCLASLLVALGRARPVTEAPIDHPDRLRLLGAVRRACSAFLFKETQLLGLVLATVGTLFGILAWLVELPAAGPPLLSMACSAIVGAALSAALAHLSFHQGLKAALEEYSAGAVAAHPGNSIVRRSKLVAIGTDAGSLLMVSGIFVVNYGYFLLSGPADPSQAAWRAALTLPPAALGAVCGGVIFQVSGNSFQTASSVASAAARTRSPSLSHSAAHNPALVAEFAGSFVGTVVSRTTDALTSAVLGDVSLILLCASFASAQLSPEQVLSLIALPLILRSIGLVASSVVASSYRFDARFPLPVLVSRSALGAISAIGLVGTLLWLVGAEPWLCLSGAGLLGLATGLYSSGLFDSEKRAALEQGGVEGLNSETARAIGVGLQRTVAPLALVAAGFWGAWELGAQSGLSQGAQFGVVVALAAMLGTNGLHLSASLLSPMSEAMDLLSSTLGSEGGSYDRKLLCKQARNSSHSGQTQVILAAVASALLAAFAISRFSIHAGSPMPDSVLTTGGRELSSGAGLPLLAGLLGTGFIIFHVGSVLRLSSRAAARVGTDLLQYLRATTASEKPRSSRALSRGYRDSVELTERASTESVIPVAIVATSIPIVLAFLLQALGGADYTVRTSQTLLAFAILAICAGAFTALAAHEAMASLTRRQAQSEPLLADSIQSAAGVEPHASASLTKNNSPTSSVHFLGRSVSPAALLGMEAALAASLTTAPFLF